MWVLAKYTHLLSVHPLHYCGRKTPSVQFLGDTDIDTSTGTGVGTGTDTDIDRYK